MASILRLADALDREHLQKVDEVRATTDRRLVRLEVRGRGELLLERWALERKARMFDDTFDRRVEVTVVTGVPGGAVPCAVGGDVKPLVARTRGPAVVAALVALAPLLSGCSAIRFGPDTPPPDLAGAYVGTLEVEGQPLAARLDLRQDGDDLSAVLRLDDVGLTAEGEGEVDRDGTFSLELDYALECPGSARLSGRWLEGGLRLAGTVAAVDCTGSQTGEFAFRRR